MRIKETPIGNGVSRFEVEHTFPCERNVPERIVDMIMRDVMKLKRDRAMNNKRCGTTTACKAPTFSRPCSSGNCCTNRFSEPSVTSCCSKREPDGIDVHVDRPIRENFWTYGEWCEALAKYRTLEQVAKDCDWEYREPMNGVSERTLSSNSCCKDFDTCVSFDDDEDDDFEWFISLS